MGWSEEARRAALEARRRKRKRPPDLDLSDAPPTLEWQHPPEPMGVPGERRAGGVGATGEANTRIGQLGEKVAEQLDMQSLLLKDRRNPLDAKYDGTQWGFEIKAVTTLSTEYKVKMKAREIREKLEYAEKNGFKPGLMIVVMDPDLGQAWIYWREGISNGRLAPELGFKFMGKAVL